jgi:hypothetical protein
MGAINYKTSDYITLGVKPYDYFKFENDAEFMEEIKNQIAEYGGNITDIINDYIRCLYEDDFLNMECELNKHHFWYFHISFNQGYYEGFTLDIEYNFPCFLDDYRDKTAAQKEITEIKNFLIACTGLGLVECFPGWCTGYSDYKQTIAAINQAVKRMRQDVRNTPTSNQYFKEG